MNNRCIKLWGIATILNVAYRYFPTIPAWERPYGVCESLSYLLFVMGGRMITEGNTKQRLWVDVFLGLTISNVYDEAFGDPYKLGSNEIIFAITIAVITIYRLRKLKHVTTSKI